MNSASVDGMYKVVLDGEPEGPACAEAASSPCFGSYWVTASASGVLGFVDTANGGPCPAFFAVADAGSSQEQGTMTIAGVAVMQSTAWVPPGYSGAYNAASRTVQITTPGCAVTYKADPAVPPAGLEFPTSAAPPLPGSATVEYFEASSSSCPADCAAGGYNVAWDATGASLLARLRRDARNQRCAGC
jgi:hypothetical protein